MLVPDVAAVLAEYAARSRWAHERLTVDRDLRYGPGAVEAIDLFRPATAGPVPLVAYVHGGYWQELSRAESAFAAAGLVDAGAALAVVGYGLAPRYRLDAIRAMTGRAVDWLLARAPALGADPDRVHLAGSSAGAHLVADAISGPAPAHRRRAEAAAGVILLSGIYDLTPLVGTYVNDALGLTAAAAWAASPLGRRPVALPPAVIARGADEPAGFVAQHDAVVAWWSARAPVTPLVVTGRNHFDLVLDLGEPGSVLGAAVRAQLDR
jgi:arylformamidase